MSRREQIEALLADDPNDAFLLYGLAMEYRKEGAYDEALTRFDQLIQQSPPYVAAFFMAGQMLAEAGRVNDARTWLRNGIEEAQRQGNGHAASEMSELLMTLGQMGE
ncbi:tetratricopeptide repeat protein [Blastopirellula sp. JC732]|uniref:Tetratricopeptide repeat protein n=1 Tax=Blastopirellula sediminis TaxID=2894196 RepID=A0A9X1MTE3_9BACT|nr:tetratricopeptide repeat protein [Blastopirellula sediminis]MCC9604641.1 tetratricopeptide repeat protein [Blastopirellula sediminis]MCC9632060.1 tetratricopeptide repeat protein [Blastopirellula sediminis]